MAEFFLVLNSMMSKRNTSFLQSTFQYSTVPWPRPDLESPISRHSAYQIVWQQEHFAGKSQGGPLFHGRAKSHAPKQSYNYNKF